MWLSKKSSVSKERRLKSKRLVKQNKTDISSIRGSFTTYSEEEDCLIEVVFETICKVAIVSCLIVSVLYMVFTRFWWERILYVFRQSTPNQC